MENELSANLYQVEKIINCRYFKNKKYYLVKWLCYPINQSTWEPKSNLKHLKYLIDDFELKYPYTVDKIMYNTFCDSIKKNKNAKKKNKLNKKSVPNQKLLSKKRNKDVFIEKDFEEPYFDRFKSHLYITVNKDHLNKMKTEKGDLIIDLNIYHNNEEEPLMNLNEKEEENETKNKEKDKNYSQLIKPILL